jgi:drug/metabolite transporter (DMT)-like permease
MTDSLIRMSRLYVPMLLLLAAIWGASFMFIKVADRQLEPTTLMAARILLAALILFGILAARCGTARAATRVRRAGWAPLLLGIVNAALPFTLIAWGEKHVDSGVAAIANASMPIFVALLALRFQRSERSSGLRLFGILLGLVGVAVLAGVHPRGGWWAVVGTLAVILASVLYAVGSLWAQRLVQREEALVLTTATMIGGALALLPLGLAQLPGSVPGWKVIGSVLALGIAGTAIGQLIYYAMLNSAGSARASLVTYLLPVTALFYGAGLLGEPITVEELVGLVLILGGVALGSGLVRLARREPAPAA